MGRGKGRESGEKRRQEDRDNKTIDKQNKRLIYVVFRSSDPTFSVPGNSIPILCTRSIACSSIAGFHHKSNIMTLDAEVRFNPTEPDLRETRRTGMEVVRKAVNIASR